MTRRGSGILPAPSQRERALLPVNSKFVASAFLALSLFAFEYIAHADAAQPLAAVRDLGVRIKNAADQTDAGHAPSSRDLSEFELRLNALSAAQSSDPAYRQKLQSVDRLLGNLMLETAHHAWKTARPLQLANLDIEQVDATRGNACSNALGIANALPVRVTLGPAGGGQDSAWFIYEPQSSGHVRFATDSSNADPALAVFPGCEANSAATAQNDDSLGLDAAVTVDTLAHQRVFVRLTNSGSGGPVSLSVANANATLTGTITDSTTGQPIGGAVVMLYGNGPSYTGISTTTDATGAYSLSAPAGSYYVVTQASQYLTLVYPNATCPYNTNIYYIANCNLAVAQTVSLSSGVVSAGINLALSAGLSINGQVRDDSNQPVAQAQVQLYDGNGNALGWVYADGVGRYSFATLPPGTYRLSAQAGGYGSQLFDHIACTGPLQILCNIGGATALSLSNQSVVNANFNLPVLPAIAGKVNASGQPAGLYYGIQINALDAFGNSVASASTDQNGNYRLGPLPSGNYFVTAAAPGSFSQIFSGIDCAQSCFSQAASATTVHVDMSNRLGQANFNLMPLPPVYGHIQDALSGSPLGGVLVYASVTPPATFWSIASAQTDSNGNYVLSNVPAGQYYLWAQGTNYIDQVYSGIDCEALPNYYGPGYANCAVIGATQLSIAPGQIPGAFNFALQPASSISGKATIRAGNGSDLPAQTQIGVYNDAGTLMASASTDANGNYVVGNLTPGTYFVAATNPAYGYGGYLMQVWKMIDCTSACAPTIGAPVSVAAQSEISGIDFNLVALNAIVGQVTDQSSNPLSGILIDLFNSTSGNYLTTATTDAKGFYAVTASPGTSYFVATDAAGSFVDQVYFGISCPAGPAYLHLCPLSNASAVGLSNNATQPVIVDFTLQRPDLIFANGFE